MIRDRGSVRVDLHAPVVFGSSTHAMSIVACTLAMLSNVAGDRSTQAAVWVRLRTGTPGLPPHRLHVDANSPLGPTPVHCAGCCPGQNGWRPLAVIEADSTSTACVESECAVPL